LVPYNRKEKLNDRLPPPPKKKTKKTKTKAKTNKNKQTNKQKQNENFEFPRKIVRFSIERRKKLKQNQTKT